MLQQLHAFHSARIALFVLGGKASQISSLAQFDGRAEIVRAMKRNPRASKATIDLYHLLLP